MIELPTEVVCIYPEVMFSLMKGFYESNPEMFLKVLSKLGLLFII